jgi:hypothetical protein
MTSINGSLVGNSNLFRNLSYKMNHHWWWFWLIYSIHFFLKVKVDMQYPSQYLNQQHDVQETVYGNNNTAVVPTCEVEATLATLNTYLSLRLVRVLSALYFTTWPIFTRLCHKKASQGHSYCILAITNNQHYGHTNVWGGTSIRSRSIFSKFFTIDRSS